jgi:2-hydroxychromene-2-carboxylate isomerase
MSKQVDYYFTAISPFTYIGHSDFLQLTSDTNTSVHYKPIKLREVFGHLGVLPVGERPKSRQAYRLLEIERWAKKRALPIILHPAYFPTDPSLADKCIIVLQEQASDAGELVARLLAACWAEEKNIADQAVLQAVLTKLGFNGSDVIEQAQTATIEAIYAANTAEAIEKGVLGAPAYLLGDEQFWGQDRLELLADRLK